MRRRASFPLCLLKAIVQTIIQGKQRELGKISKIIFAKKVSLVGNGKHSGQLETDFIGHNRIVDLKFFLRTQCYVAILEF